jgi:hypothetical protein
VTKDGPEPPALGVKVNVAPTSALAATRSDAAMLKVTFATAPPITPLETAGLETIGSVFVRTVTESAAALAAPMVQPKSVTVTAVPAISGAVPPTVNTMEVAPGCAGVSVAPVVDNLPVGVTVVAKKPDG